jgi:hypothetical protein
MVGLGRYSNAGYTVWDGDGWYVPSKLDDNARNLPYRYGANMPADWQVAVATDTSEAAAAGAIAAWTTAGARRLRHASADFAQLTYPVWTTPAEYSIQPSANPALAVEVNMKAASVQQHQGKCYASWGSSSQGIPAGTPVSVYITATVHRPAAAALGDPSLFGAVWESGGDIWGSRTAVGTWVSAIQFVPGGLPGNDRNPDIASRCGSHTMPPKP